MRQILARSEHCLGCKSCELACAVTHSTSKNLFEAIEELKPPQKRIFVESNGDLNFPLQCRQCLDSPCVHACISGAMQFDLKTGLIQVDEQKCVNRIDPVRQLVQSTDGREWSYSKLLLAIGASANKLTILGGNLPEVFTLRTMKDALAINNILERGAQKEYLLFC